MDGATGIFIFIIVLILVFVVIWAIWAARRRLGAGAACTSDSQCASGACAASSPLFGSPTVCCAGGKGTQSNVSVCLPV